MIYYGVSTECTSVMDAKNCYNKSDYRYQNPATFFYERDTSYYCNVNCVTRRPTLRVVDHI